jgi:two-component sensor histidine kinase
VNKGAQDYLIRGQMDGRLLKCSIQYSLERKKIDEVLANIEITRKKEIHHRIKNNLQIISSLLALQADKFKSKMESDEFRSLRCFKGKSGYSIISMAPIHKEL